MFWKKLQMFFIMKIVALGTIALSKIEHLFPNISFTEEKLEELDKLLTSLLILPGPSLLLPTTLSNGGRVVSGSPY